MSVSLICTHPQQHLQALMSFSYTPDVIYWTNVISQASLLTKKDSFLCTKWMEQKHGANKKILQWIIFSYYIITKYLFIILKIWKKVINQNNYTTIIKSLICLVNHHLTARDFPENSQLLKIRSSLQLNGGSTFCFLKELNIFQDGWFRIHLLKNK